MFLISDALLVVSAANRVIFNWLYVDIELPESVPQGLKPGHSTPFAARLKSCPFKT